MTRQTEGFARAFGEGMGPQGASLRDRAGGLRPEPAAQSQPQALIPCAEPPFAEEFPRLTWLLKAAGGYLAIYAAFGFVVLVSGLAAGLWFCGGYVLAAMTFLYEAGRNAIAMEARQGGDGETRLHPKDDSAGPQDIAQPLSGIK